jgi:hypothetical protein
MDDEGFQHEGGHESEPSDDDSSDPAYEPDVVSGDVLDGDELEEEIADDEGMAGSDLHEPTPAGEHALQQQVHSSQPLGHDGDDAQGDPDDVQEHDVVDHAEHDSQVDAELDSWDDGSEAVGRSETSGALPFVVSAREEFAALGDVPVTGEPRVDAATARLDEVTDLPTTDHVAVYDDVHRRLQDALADADAR